MIYTVTFNPAIDYVVETENFLTNQVNRSEYESIYYGGKGINVSIILHRLGIATKALGFVAGFTGREIIEGIDTKGIENDFIHLKHGLSRINIKIKAHKTKEETELNCQGPVITPEDLNILYKKLTLLTEDDKLVLAGSIPKSLPVTIYGDIMKYLSNKNIPITVDATGNLLKNVLVHKPFLIKPNNHELGQLFDKKIETQEDIILHAKELQNMGARNVLISMAGNGSILLTETKEIIQMPAPKGTVQNSVGAGDSMVAGFLAGYEKTKDYSYALKLGTAAGSATAFSKDLATKEAIENIFCGIQDRQYHTVCH